MQKMMMMMHDDDQQIKITIFSPSKPVNEEELARAAKAIQYVEQGFLNTCSKRHKVAFDIAKSDYHIRRAQMNGSMYTPELKRECATNGEISLFFSQDIAKIDFARGLDNLGNVDHVISRSWALISYYSSILK